MGSYRENHWDTVVVLIHLNSKQGICETSWNILLM